LPDDLPKLVTMAEVMEALGASRQAVKRLIDLGELPAIKVGPQFRFRTDEVLAFLERQRVPVR
jgi:excisionase family DNA binding protein